LYYIFCSSTTRAALKLSYRAVELGDPARSGSGLGGDIYTFKWN
jgi:hypothetical protein